MPHGGVGHRLADLCARLATWLHVAAKEGDRQGASPDQTRRRAAPAASLSRKWVRGGALAAKTEQLTQNSKLELANRHFYLLPARHNLLFGSCAPLCDGLGYSGSELGKLITCWATYGTCHCMNLHLVISTPLVETATPRNGVQELEDG